MDDLRKAAQAALEALEALYNGRADENRDRKCWLARVDLRAALAQPDQPTADGPISDPWRSAPDLAASDRGLPEPAAYARWWEQNAYSVQQLECLRKLPEVEAYWKDRSKLALFTASQMLAFRAEGKVEGVAQERERCAKVCEGPFGVNSALNDEEAYYGRQMAGAIRKG